MPAACCALDPECLVWTVSAEVQLGSLCIFAEACDGLLSYYYAGHYAGHYAGQVDLADPGGCVAMAGPSRETESGYMGYG